MPTHESNVRHSSASNEHFTPPAVVEAARAVMGSIHLDPASCALANSVVRATLYLSVAEHRDNPTLETPWTHLDPMWAHRGISVFLNPPGGKCDVHGTTVYPPAIRGEGWTCNPSKEKCGCGHLHTRVSSSQKAWWKKLVREHEAGNVREAIFVGFSLEILQTSQVGARDSEKIPLDFPFCVPSRRIAYFKDDGTGTLVEGSSPPHASVLIYLPPKQEDRARDEAQWQWWNRFALSFGKFGRVISNLEKNFSRPPRKG